MSYGFRHGKSSSTSSSMSRTSSRSTSTGTPPQTPTIRVTSPVPDAIGVIDIWDPEILSDDEPQAPTSPIKTYSFRYSEEKKRCKSGSARTRRQREAREAAAQNDRKHQKTWADTGMQSEDPTPLLPAEQSEEDGLKTPSESLSSSSSDEGSQISAVTQVPLDCAQSANSAPDESSASPPGEKPVKKVQFNRSLSLVPTTAPLLPGAKGTIGAGRRYSSLDCAPASVPIDLFPFTDEQPQPVTSGCQVLSPTPESALEADQSPVQDKDESPQPANEHQQLATILPPVPVGLAQLSGKQTLHFGLSSSLSSLHT